MSRINLDGYGIFGIIFGLGSLGYTAYRSYKSSKVEAKLGMVMDEVEKKAAIDVEQQVIDRTIERAVERKVARAASEGVEAVKADMHATIAAKVKKEVEAQYGDLANEVSEKISDQVAAISEDALANRVLPRVEEKLTKRGDQMLEKVRSTANDKLRSFVGVYDGIENILGGALNRNKTNNANRSITLNYD